MIRVIYPTTLISQFSTVILESLASDAGRGQITDGWNYLDYTQDSSIDRLQSVVETATSQTGISAFLAFSQAMNVRFQTEHNWYNDQRNRTEKRLKDSLPVLFLIPDLNATVPGEEFTWSEWVLDPHDFTKTTDGKWIVNGFRSTELGYPSLGQIQVFLDADIEMILDTQSERAKVQAVPEEPE